MVSKHFLLFKSSVTVCAHFYYTRQSFSSRTCLFHSGIWDRLVPFASSRHISPIYRRAPGYGYTPYAALRIPSPTPGVDYETLEKQLVDQNQLTILRQKLEDIGVDGKACRPGRHNGLICPNCKGGDSQQKSLSLRIFEDGGAAKWTCFRDKCRWKGTASAFSDVSSTYSSWDKIIKAKQPTKIISVESLGLEPLCDELLAYFADRMISRKTLQRNAVMQKRNGDQIAIAFTYWRNGELISCKYRSITKRFWQEANTEKIFYGMDDIKEASDIIIVEGEIDKLAMEEAGFKNCVSVPDGAPPKVPKKETWYQYLSNCKDYTEKASRIILATDGDRPGQLLAEELARHLGRERCWRVKWPKKNSTDSFIDANEVLMYLGPDALKEVTENAEPTIFDEKE